MNYFIKKDNTTIGMIKGAYSEKEQLEYFIYDENRNVVAYFRDVLEEVIGNIIYINI